jgi:hypothetical protein
MNFIDHHLRDRLWPAVVYAASWSNSRVTIAAGKTGAIWSFFVDTVVKVGFVSVGRNYTNQDNNNQNN